MLRHHLQSAIENLDRLIDLTQSDIEDVKAAKHESMFDRIKTKEHALVAFESTKALIDQQISHMVQENSTTQLPDLLSDEESALLDQMREKLQILQANNRRFAKLVIGIGEFYNALYEKILPVEKEGYHGSSLQTASLIEVRA